MQGGFKMFDLKRFIYALKASWVSRLVDIENKGKWKQIYQSQLKQLEGILTFECNLNNKKAENITKIGSFISDVLLSWIEINSKSKHENSISC